MELKENVRAERREAERLMSERRAVCGDFRSACPECMTNGVMRRKALDDASNVIESQNGLTWKFHNRKAARGRTCTGALASAAPCFHDADSSGLYWKHGPIASSCKAALA